MTDFALIDSAGLVVNIVVADQIGDVAVPDGQAILPVGPNAEIGGAHDGTAFIGRTRPPPPEPTATGAQMIYEAEARGKLAALSVALSAPEMMKLTARRRIIAGDDIAEAVRVRLGVTAAAMSSFIAAAAVRSEV